MACWSIASRIINQAHAHVLTACGYPMTEHDLVERFCGMSDREMLEIIEREWGRPLPTFYAERVGLMIEAGFGQSLAPTEGVAEALGSLEIAGLRRVEQQPGADPSETEDNRPSWPFWRTPGSSATMVARASRLPICFFMPRSGLRQCRAACLVIEIALQVSMPPSLRALNLRSASPVEAIVVRKHGARLEAARSGAGYIRRLWHGTGDRARWQNSSKPREMTTSNFMARSEKPIAVMPAAKAASIPAGYPR